MRDRFGDNPFNESDMERTMRESRRHEYSQMDRRDREKRIEDATKPWFDSGGFNVFRSEHLPRPTRPYPSHPDDHKEFK